jgi:hypothetical protein
MFFVEIINHQLTKIKQEFGIWVNVASRDIKEYNGGHQISLVLIKYI